LFLPIVRTKEADPLEVGFSFSAAAFGTGFTPREPRKSAETFQNKMEK
jgi:hypothetical protein